MEQCQRNTWCWMPNHPSASWLLRASCWRWKRVGRLPSLSQVYHQTRARVLWHSVRQPESTLPSFWSEPWSLGAFWAGTWQTDSRVRSKCSVPSFSVEPSGSRDTHGVKKHVIIIYEDSLLQDSYGTSRSQDTAKAHLLSDCPPAFTHQDRTCISDIKRELWNTSLLCHSITTAIFAGHVTIPVSGLKCSTPSNPISVDSVNGLFIISFIFPSWWVS